MLITFFCSENKKVFIFKFSDKKKSTKNFIKVKINFFHLIIKKISLQLFFSKKDYPNTHTNEQF